MHEHKFRKISIKGKWLSSPDKGVLLAYEKWVNFCDCGEQKEIKTHPKGIWRKAATRNAERVQTYPSEWLELLKSLLKAKINLGSFDIEINAKSALRATGGGWNEFERLVSSLLKDGVIEIFEPYPKRSQKDQKLVFKAEIIDQLRGTLGFDLIIKEREKVDKFFETWEPPPLKAGSPANVIFSLLGEMKLKWAQSGKTTVPLGNGSETIMKSLSNYVLFLETIRTIVNTSLSSEILSFRELSVRITGDSKGLENIRNYLKDALGDLNYYGIVEHSPFIFCRLPVTGKINGKTIDLTACDDYMSLTLRSAKTFKPELSKMKRLILIENLTPFETLARDHERLGDNTGILFISGYPPSHISEFVKKLMNFSPFEGLIWCDLDPDGVEIALTAAKWFEKVSWSPLFMDKEFLQSSVNKPLSENDLNKLCSIKTRNDIAIFDSLISEMWRLSKKVEQEAQKISLPAFF